MSSANKEENSNKQISGRGNKFKPGDIITNFKTPTWYFRPAKEWIHNINIVSATWKVVSIEPNGDYKLQRLDTLTKSRLLEKDSPIYQKEKTMSKEMIDSEDYKLWDKDDVKSVYKRALDEVKLFKEVQDSRLKQYNEEMKIQTPSIKEFFKTNKSIEATANKFRLDNEEVWDVLDEDELKGAKDYDSVKEELFDEDDKTFEKFTTATNDIIKDNQKINSSTKRVLGDTYLNTSIGEYFRKSTKGGKKSKKTKKGFKKRRGKRVKRKTHRN